MSERTCETCRWWDTPDDECGRGMCRVRAPRYTGHSWTMKDGKTTQGGGWPDTGRNDWCGEHQPREVRDE